MIITNEYPFGGGDCNFISTEAEELMKEFKTAILSGENGTGCFSLAPEETEVVRTSCKINIRLFVNSLCIKELWPELKLAKQGANWGIWVKRAKNIIRYNYVAQYYQIFITKKIHEQKNFYTYWNTARTLAIVRMKKKNPCIRIITRMHGMDLFNERTNGNWQPFRDETSKALDGVFFVSQNGKEYYEQRWKLNSKAVVEVAYLGCQGGENYEKSWNRKLVIASCSNCIPLKRVGLLIDSLALINNIQLEWHHFGAGAEMENLQRKSEMCLGKLQNVTWTFHGFVENKELMRKYKDLGVNLFITLSQTEGLPISIIEAFSCGVPAIATAVGGIPEIVLEGKTGYLLACNPQVTEVASAIRHFWNLSDNEKMKLSENAYELWQLKFQAEKNAENFCKTIKRIFE
ncbi:MAG: glycosyltransferase [Oscillospiraceae bacterium]